MKTIQTLLHVVLFLVLNVSCFAASVTQDQVRQMAAGWLKSDGAPLNMSMGSEVGKIASFYGDNSEVLGYAVYFEPSGVIIVPADDRIEPVVAFADSGNFDASANHPLAVLVIGDLKARMRFLDSAKAGAAGNAETQRARDKWDLLRNRAGLSLDSKSLGGVSDLRVPPLVQSVWDQEEESGYQLCYNYFTPDHYPCGCVATAMAQLMRYHCYPTAAVGPRQFEVTVENDPNPYWTMTILGGDGAGGAYNWNMMPLDPDANTSVSQCQSIGALCLDAGISVGMRYGPFGSSADIFTARDSLVNVFYFGNAVGGYNNFEYIGAGLVNMVNPNLDAGYPALFGISGSAGSHAVVCDGYGYNCGTLYHHLNMGWGTYHSVDNAWYALPNIDATLEFDSVEACLYNIFTSGSGEIISGRISDGLGNPISGAIVTAYRSGGGAYQTSSNRRGVYALAKVPSSSVYTITVGKSGYSFAARSVSTGVSEQYNNVAGNQAGIDFIGAGAYAAEPVAYPLLADYDGNGRADPTIYRDDFSKWYIRLAGNTNTIAFGIEGCQPVFADFDGDGFADPAVYSDSLGLWAFELSASKYVMVLLVFGNPGSHPVAADFDGDGRADPALYQESTGLWLVMLSKSGYALTSLTVGGPGFRPVAGDFDGDGLGDPALFQYSSGYWSVMMSASGYQPTMFAFGAAGAQAAAGDYDGDGKADPAIYQSSSGLWTILRSGSGYAPATLTFF